jgi:hypothetical protein
MLRFVALLGPVGRVGRVGRVGGVPSSFYAAGAVLSLGLGLGAVSCVNVQSDYTDWYNKTAPERAAGVPGDEAGPVEASTVDGGLDQPFNQTYVMVCTSQEEVDNVTYATYFTATFNYTPNTSGGGGTLSYSDQSVALSSLSPPTPPTSISSPIGSPVSASNIVVSPEGKAYVAFGNSVVPGADDPLEPDNPVVFTDTHLYFTITSPSQICANLGGTTTAPIGIPFLDPTQNICLYVPTTGPVTTTFTNDQFKCPYTPGQYPGEPDDGG